MIGGKWKIPILWHLFDGPRRFSELHRALAPITQKVLTQQLRELEADALLTRTVYPEVPPRVDYALTPRGRSLRPIIHSLCTWSKGCRK
jgi:DNA-binding HxlR family transcriptional regulator